MEVGSVSGLVEISNALKVVSTVQPGSVSAFTFANTAAASGATVATATSTKVALMLGAGTAAALLSLGLAIDSVAQPTSATRKNANAKLFRLTPIDAAAQPREAAPTSP